MASPTPDLTQRSTRRLRKSFPEWSSRNGARRKGTHTGHHALIADSDLLAEAKLEPHNLWLYFQSDFPYLFPDTFPELTAHWCCIHRDMVKLAYLCEKPGKREAVLAKLAVREAAMLKQIERIGARA